MLLAASRGRTLVSLNFSTSQYWSCPATTNRIESLSAHGASGQPAVPGTPAQYATTQVAAAIVDFFGNNGSTGTTAGNVTWDLMHNTAMEARNAINAGAVITSGPLPITCRKVVQYRNGSSDSYTLRTETVYTASGVTPNSATVVVTGGWGYSGAVGKNVSYFTEMATVEYQYQSNPGTPVTPPTTGQSASAFSYEFAGGTGGAANPVYINLISVSPGGSYYISVPPGAYVGFSYFV